MFIVFLPIMIIGFVISIIGLGLTSVGKNQDLDALKVIGAILILLGMALLFALIVYFVLSECGVIPQFIPLY